MKKENSVLSLEFENKLKTNDSHLETNSSLLKSIRNPSSLATEDFTSTYSKVSNFIQEINREEKLIQHKNYKRLRSQISQILNQRQQRIVLLLLGILWLNI